MIRIPPPSFGVDWRCYLSTEFRIRRHRDCTGSVHTNSHTAAMVHRDPSINLTQIDGQFGAILADPPWRFANRTGKMAPEHKRLRRYHTMRIDEICALPVA